MKRRTFLQVTSVAALTGHALADQPMPKRVLGKTGLEVSRITVGGHHALAKGEEEFVRVVHRAIDLGVNFFDCAHKYRGERSDAAYGVALAGGLRQGVLLMSKAEKRDRESAMRQLEETLQRMQTDYLDLWQCHEVTTQEEVDKILAPGGSLEAFVQAKEQGKVRHIGFTGHADPAVHLRLLESFDGWETVQMPINLVDQHYESFIDNVLPNARAKGLGVLGMKSNAMGGIARNNVATIPECLRFAWTQDIDTLVSGVESVEQLEENVAGCKSFEPMTESELAALLERTRQGPHGIQVENYKHSLDNAFHVPHRDGEEA